MAQLQGGRTLKQQKQDRKQKGITLIELMIAVAIIGIIAAISMPIYTDYIETARRGALLDSMQTIRLLEEGERVSNGVYQAGTYDPDDPNNSNGLTAKIGWAPGTTSDEVTYVVDNVTGTSFRVTATHSDGTQEQRTYTRN